MAEFSLGLLVDFTSGIFFLALAGLVALKRPRTRAGLWFALFAFSLAIRILIDNAVRLAWVPVEPFTLVHLVMFPVTALVASGAAVGMVRSTVGIRAPIALLLAPAVYLFAILAYSANGFSFGYTVVVGSTSVYNLCLWWIIWQMNGDMPAIAGALMPYATAYTLVPITNVLGPGMTAATWALWWSQ